MLSAKLNHQLQLLPQLEHDDAGPKSMLELILNPYPKKSTVTGLAFSSKSLSMINWNPLTSYTLSVFLGSSRAIANEGPPHPPSLRKIRIGTISRSLKYSEICRLAASVTSTITSSLDWNMISAIQLAGMNLIVKFYLHVNYLDQFCQWLLSWPPRSHPQNRQWMERIYIAHLTASKLGKQIAAVLFDHNRLSDVLSSSPVYPPRERI